MKESLPFQIATQICRLGGWASPPDQRNMARFCLSHPVSNSVVGYFRWKIGAHDAIEKWKGCIGNRPQDIGFVMDFHPGIIAIGQKPGEHIVLNCADEHCICSRFHKSSLSFSHRYKSRVAGLELSLQAVDFSIRKIKKDCLKDIFRQSFLIEEIQVGRISQRPAFLFFKFLGTAHAMPTYPTFVRFASQLSLYPFEHHKLPLEVSNRLQRATNLHLYHSTNEKPKSRINFPKMTRA
jgi:hypothetical protein